MFHISNLDLRIAAFAKLGEIMGHAAEGYTNPDSEFAQNFPALANSLQSATLSNPWFTKANIAFALKEWHTILNDDAIRTWLSHYESGSFKQSPKTVAVIMAGNIPMVGFHDFMCVLLSGNGFLGKLSSDDKILLPALAEVLCVIEPSFREAIQFTESTLTGFDAIIATGSNNTARYFEYYFSKYPHIIRKNRNGVAVLGGKENEESFRKLGADICTYFGLGCRNVSKIFLPSGFAPERIFAAIEPYNHNLSEHFKYMNNYSYQHSIYLLNKTPHLDNGVFILAESAQYASPIPVLFYEFYEDIEVLKKKLSLDDEFIQCIATDIFTSERTVPPGKTQSPGLNDFADGIDTMKFLLSL